MPAWSLRNGSTDDSLRTGDHETGLTVNDVFTAKHLLIPLMIPLVNYGVPKLKALWVYLRVR